MSQMFQKKVENFRCEHCGKEVIGNGYTNHCPQCLWSKHVDMHPGDRRSTCNGLMKPIDCTYEHNQFVMKHRCEKCGYEKRNKLSSGDNVDIAIEIVKQNNAKLGK